MYTLEATITLQNYSNLCGGGGVSGENFRNESPKVQRVHIVCVWGVCVVRENNKEQEK